jgi:hypothetical protein
LCPHRSLPDGNAVLGAEEHLCSARRRRSSSQSRSSCPRAASGSPPPACRPGSPGLRNRRSSSPDRYRICAGGADQLRRHARASRVKVTVQFGAGAQLTRRLLLDRVIAQRPGGAARRPYGHGPRAPRGADRLAAGRRHRAEGPGWREPRSYGVRECLLCILSEEREHRGYSERDLATLTAQTASH